MKKKGLRKGYIIGFMCMAIVCLLYSPGFGQIGFLPYTENISVEYGNLLNYNTYNSSLFLSPALQTYSSASTVTNPFAATSNQSSFYGDLFSTAASQSFNYTNVFGFSYSTGSDTYKDPLYSSGAGFVDVAVPGGGYSSGFDYTHSLVGGSTHYDNTVVLPWTIYSAEIDTGYGLDAFPYGQGYTSSSLSVGTPTIFSGGDRWSEGIYNLMAFAPMAAPIAQELSNRPMYTDEGMPFYGGSMPYYFNPYSASNSYFAPGAQVTAGGAVPGYAASATMTSGVWSPVGGGVGAVMPTGSLGAVTGALGSVTGGVGAVGGTGSPAAAAVSLGAFVGLMI